MGTESDDYLSLKNLKLEIVGEESFCLCFWIYLVNLTSATSAVIRQMRSGETNSYPFLIIYEKKIILLPLVFPYNKACDHSKLTNLVESPCASASADFNFPLKKWVHLGCEVSNNVARLHIDGEIAGEEHLSSLWNNASDSSILNRVTLISVDENDILEGYIHNMQVLPITTSIKVHHIKNPPLQLSVDNSSVLGIEEGSDGIWNIIGGKESCHKIFSLDVILLNSFGQPAYRELEVVASLLFDDNKESGGKNNDSETPLLATYNGIEFASWDKPAALFNGRTSFKLKISKLSSKCDNKLFRMRFFIPKFRKYPFFEVFSQPIRCISRNPCRRTTPITCNAEQENESQSSDLDDATAEAKNNVGYESKSLSSSKRAKLGEYKSPQALKTTSTRNEESLSYVSTINRGDNMLRTNTIGFPENHDPARISLSDSESEEGRALSSRCWPNRNPISDITVFKYCLGNLTDRYLILNEIATSASDQDLKDFARQVSLYSGCSHHWQQISIAKRLLDEGRKVWKSMSQNGHHIQWGHAMFEIQDQFMKISRCTTRALTQQDFAVLRTIAGCGESLRLENFNNLWRWLFPVAHAISEGRVSALWRSSPKWIEGFVTKEEAEWSLPRDEGPGTFVLRFPTSRSWPHPDAGSLIVTYVGHDYTLRHRMLSLHSILRLDLCP